MKIIRFEETTLKRVGENPVREELLEYLPEMNKQWCFEVTKFIQIQIQFAWQIYFNIPSF